MDHRVSIPRLLLCLVSFVLSVVLIACPAGTLFDMVKQTTQATLAPQIVIRQGVVVVEKDKQIDLGIMTKGEVLDVAFSVTNNGQNTLELNGAYAIAVSGSAAFTVVTQPAASISPGQSSAFGIRFSPTDLTRQVADIIIRSNDPKNDPFAFSLTGVGIEVQIPQIKIQLNAQEVVHESSQDVGFSTPNAPLETTFTIQNLGHVPLVLSGNPLVGLSNTVGNAFQVTQQPESTVQPSMSTNFKVNFIPVTTGSYKAHVSVASNDPNRPSYAFDLTGTCKPQGTVVSPNGGEAYRPGTTCKIRWTYFGGDAGNVRLELLKNDVAVATIVDSITDNGSYNWTVPESFDEAEGNDYKVKASSINTPTFNDTSDASFAIGNVTVTAPNGGEMFVPGGSITITWNSGIGGNVRIDLMKNGQTAATIAPSTNNTGSYSWTIPANLTLGSDYTIVVSTLIDPSVSDASDGTFVVENITVTAPNDGEGYQPNSTCAISWASGGYGNVEIDLYRGSTLNAVITSSTANNGTYSWVIPSNQEVGTDYKIRITHNTNAIMFDESNSSFTIGTIGVTSPAGAEVWKPGDDHTITWDSAIGGSVAIDLYKGGVLNSAVVTSTPNTGSYSWTVPSLSGSDYRIHVRSVSCPAIWGESPATFASGTIAVTSPNGGEICATGETRSITWSSAIGGTVRIDLYKSGSLNSTITASTANSGSYIWSVPSLSGADYAICVTSNQNISIFDSSDTPFAAGTVAVTAPNGGSSYIPTTSTNITWTSAVGGNVKIELWKGGSLDSTIVASTANNGSYSWTIPAGQADGTTYRIKVSSLSNANVTDQSDADFTISYWMDFGFVASVDAQLCQIAVGTDHLPLVAYKNTTTLNLQVAKWNGSGWTDLGSPASGNGVDFSLATVGNTPEIVYVDVANGSKPHIKLWSSGTTWTDYGYPATAAAKSVSICGQYVAVATSGNQVTVSYCSGPSNYRNCGTVTSATDNVALGARALTVCQDAHGANHPVVVYSQYSTDTSIKYKPHVWYGSPDDIITFPYQWTDFGYPSAGSSGQSTDNSLALTIRQADPQYGQHPVIMYTDGNSLHVKQWSYSSSTWQDMGAPYSGTVYSGANGLSIEQNLCVSFRDAGASGRGRLVKMVGGVWQDLGYFSSGVASYTGVVIDTSDYCPIVVYCDVASSNHPQVKKRYLP